MKWYEHIRYDMSIYDMSTANMSYWHDRVVYWLYLAYKLTSKSTVKTLYTNSTELNQWQRESFQHVL